MAKGAREECQNIILVVAKRLLYPIQIRFRVIDARDSNNRQEWIIAFLICIYWEKVLQIFKLLYSDMQLFYYMIYYNNKNVFSMWKCMLQKIE